MCKYATHDEIVSIYVCVSVDAGIVSPVRGFEVLHNNIDGDYVLVRITGTESGVSALTTLGQVNFVNNKVG
jgi:hypothetical protein